MPVCVCAFFSKREECMKKVVLINFTLIFFLDTTVNENSEMMLYQNGGGDRKSYDRAETSRLRTEINRLQIELESANRRIQQLVSER